MLGVKYRKLFAATTISNLGDGVSLIAYPWLASAITRNPLLIALVAVVQRLPWLLFTLPAGVIVDRSDRRRLMVVANTARFLLTAVVAVAVFVRRDTLPAPDAVESVVGTDAGLYLLLIAATMLLGVGEVLYDNSAQTFLPSIVADDQLERANGRMYSAEMVANQFAGPPLAGLLLAIGFALPFVVDAGSFAASAALIASIAVARRRPPAEGRPIRSGGPRSARGSAGCGTTRCCGRWRSRSPCSTCAATWGSPCSSCTARTCSGPRPPSSPSSARSSPSAG